MKANRIKADEILKQAVQRLKSKGLDEARLERLTVSNDTGLANSPLVMGQARTYDAILLSCRNTQVPSDIPVSAYRNESEHRRP